MVENQLINLGMFPERPSIAQVDAILRRISDEIGHVVTGYRHYGFWQIRVDGTPYGLEPGQRTTNFAQALSRALGLPVAHSLTLTTTLEENTSCRRLQSS